MSPPILLLLGLAIAAGGFLAGFILRGRCDRAAIDAAQQATREIAERNRELLARWTGEDADWWKDA